jgi:hypothetical protein
MFLTRQELAADARSHLDFWNLLMADHRHFTVLQVR